MTSWTEIYAEYSLDYATVVNDTTIGKDFKSGRMIHVNPSMNNWIHKLQLDHDWTSFDIMVKTTSPKFL